MSLILNHVHYSVVMQELKLSSRTINTTCRLMTSVECCNYYVVNVFSATVLIPALHGDPFEPLKTRCLGRPRRTLDL